MGTYFDAALSAQLQPAECAGLCGGIALSAQQRVSLQRAFPEKRWLLQQRLNLLIGPGDPRYPEGSPELIALEFSPEEWLRVLFLPDREWHALASSGGVLRLMLPAGTRTAAGVSRLAERFPRTRFLIDPFRHGPEPRAGWQSQVCLAEHDNVWITTRGLVDQAGAQWTPEAVNDALHFVVGEVGAGRLLFASDGKCLDADEWLQRAPFLDRAQRELILRINARELFGDA